MKKSSLKCVLLLLAFIAFNSGCKNPEVKKNHDADYKQVLKLVQTGNFFMHENEPDSALASFRKGLAILNNPEDTAEQKKDTSYCEKTSFIYGYISSVYSNLKMYDSALGNELKALNWGSKAHQALANRLVSNANIGYYYEMLGNEKGKGSEKCIAIYSKGIKYTVAACWEFDSLGNKSDDALTNYYRAMNMYGVLGDTVRENFYRSKYHQLKDYLHPGNSQSLPIQQEQKKPGQTKTTSAPIDDTTNETKETFNKRWNKRLDDILKRNTVPGTVTDTDEDGRITTRKTVISNGEATITTSINGVLKETQRIKLN